VTGRAYDGLVVDDVGVLSGVRDDEAALLEQVLRTARAAGLRTGLLSNAGGCGRPEWPDLFDTVVLSGIAGVAKPDEAAFLLVAERLGVAPERCVFVDDLRRNVLGAAATGMTGVHHRSAEATLEELEVLLGLPLRA
jgi:epoxide hydrolase-like predicted phosphatase